MKIENVTEVNISIEEVMDEDKSPKDRCVENCMDRIHEAITTNSKYARKFSTVVGEQLRRAWNEGYKYAYGTCWKNAAAHNITKEIVAAEKAKSVWDMLMKIDSEYEQEELEEAFGVETIGDVIREWGLEEFMDRFKEYDAERDVIHVGDEIGWRAKEPCGTLAVEYTRHVGIVLDIKDKYYVVLTNDATGSYFYKGTVTIAANDIWKTHSRFNEFIRKEES